ncbi:MAG: YicC family protein [Gammaproteobacteria bacterium]|nr:YicC family protein [Gammaproteobacteria bacterium]
MTLKPTDQTTTTLKINPPLISALLEASKTIESMADQPLSSFSALDILKWPGALHQPETDRDALQNATLLMMREALQRFVQEREREGLQLGLLIKSRCELIQEETGKARQRLPIVKEQIREKVLSRLSDLALNPDTDRLEQELVYLAQKMDVAEELDRLDLHLLEILKTLDQKEPAGRRLDFLIQELHREANTLGSKSGDIETSRHSVEIKVLIEQMREQVQNIE